MSWPFLVSYSRYCCFMACRSVFVLVSRRHSHCSNVTPDVATAMVVSAQRMTSSLDSFTLVAIPLFILAGAMMNTGGIAVRLVELAKVVVGWMPGSMAHITCVANALFGAISGSAAASAAAVGSAMSPLQRKAGYDMPFCAAANVASSPCGLLIPPSGASSFIR